MDAPVPRLRLSRQPLSAVADRPVSPEQGPSRPRDRDTHEPAVTDDDNDPLPTPKGNHAVASAEATARLRALLSRMPNHPKSPVARPVSPSELDSDFEPPRFSPTPPSVAKESLKDIFSRALRDPGDTPVKGKPRDSPGENRPTRRRSFGDTSDSEAAPATKNKGKRKSLSDEEVEKLKSSQRSEASFRSSQAQTFDTLRERLNNSQTLLKDQAPLFGTPSGDDTATFLRDLDSSRATPPFATSTPPHSLEMSANSKYQTNLMEHDSEMQHMMKDLDSFEGDSRPSRPVSFPSSRGKPTRPGPSHAHSSTSPSHRFSYNGSRPVSQTSAHSGTDGHDQSDHVRELEREWNKPHPKPHPVPERHHSHSHSHGAESHGPEHPRSHSPMVAVNGHARVRTRSSGSVHSTEDTGSSKGNSVSSHSDYNERMLEMEKERNAEREHAWNRPQPARPTSSLSVHSPVDRSRKLSTPTRPGSSLSTHHPTRPPASPRPGSSLSVHHPPGISRHNSASSSRTSSDEEEEEIIHEIQHERERNWGAPIPKWGHHQLPAHNHHPRSKSPMPPSPSASTPSNLRSTDRVRAESLKSRGSPKGHSPVHESPHFTQPTASSSKISARETPTSQARPKSLLGSASRPRPVSYPARPNSPLPPPRPHSPLPPIEAKPKSRPAISTSASTHSIRKPTPQPPRSPERDRGHSRAPFSPSPSPGQRSASRSSMTSHIPVRSPGKAPSKALNGNGNGHVNGHSKIPSAPQHSNTLPVQKPAEIPRISEPELLGSADGSPAQGHHDPFTETDEEEHRTPTVETIVVPPLPRPVERSPSPRSPRVTSDEEIFQKALTVPPPPSPPPSPPTPTVAAPPTIAAPRPLTPPPPEAPSTILGLLSTPPKRPSFHSSRLEFQTPSPPHGLPELPGPPSSDEETETERAATPSRFNGAADLTSTKTPRPPGAWASTPAPPVRSHSLPPPTEPEESDSQNDSGLATPVASFSRASSFPAPTPKPPGGWVATPTPRKSILKVRFNPRLAELELSAAEDMSSTNGHPEESASTGLATPDDDEESFRTRTPEPAPVSPSRSPRRSPTVRVVDEYGRPDQPKPTKSPKNRNKNPVRIVDAMGREVEPAEQSIKAEAADDAPLNHNEALRDVRSRVSDLVQTLDELDLSSDFDLLNEDRLRELDNASRAARGARDDLKQEYDDRTAQLRANMQRSKSQSQEREVDSRSNSPRVWLWTFIILSQALLIFLAYRLQKRSARELFLTTYYDPFYPDLHLYGIKYDYITFPRTPPSIASLTNTLRQEGFKAFVGNIVDMTALLFADWRADTWARWGGDDMQSMRWPPT